MTPALQEKALLETTLKRRRCRASLAAWAEECGFKPAKHHLLFIDLLERVTRNELPNDKLGAIFLVPPGSAKSTYASVLFPPWFLGQRPRNNILACSYSFTLAERFGKRCRNLIEEKQKVLGYGLSKHSQAAGDWETSTGSVYFAAGVGAGIAGHRADLGLVDDFLGSQEDADSQLIRDKQYDWFWNDFYPRLKPGAKIVIIANRRHEDDLVGRLLEQDPDKWIVIRIPFFAEEDDPLGREPNQGYNVESRIWPEWFTEAMAEQIKKLPARTLAGLYQQRPAPIEGDYFKADWLVGYTIDDLAAAEKRGLRYYCASDHAVKERECNDRNCLLSAGVDDSGRIFILPDWCWKRCKTDELVDQMFQMAKRRKPIRWFAGRDHITGSLGPFITKRMVETGIFFPIEEMTATRDLQARAQPIAGRMAAKMVLFPTFAPNWDMAQHEILTFPSGTHDDFVAALAELGRGLASMHSADAPEAAQDEVLREGWRPTVKWVLRSDARKREEERVAFLDN